MQTFLPYPDFYKSLKCLDTMRLGKQRVEALQLINALEGKTQGWRNHPACIMWENNVDALKLYHDMAIIAWTNRGYKNNMPLKCTSKSIRYPDWFGNVDFHAAHRSNLLRKDFNFYHTYGWTESTTLPYIWPKPSIKVYTQRSKSNV